MSSPHDRNAGRLQSTFSFRLWLWWSWTRTARRRASAGAASCSRTGRPTATPCEPTLPAGLLLPGNTTSALPELPRPCLTASFHDAAVADVVGRVCLRSKCSHRASYVTSGLSSSIFSVRKRLRKSSGTDRLRQRSTSVWPAKLRRARSVRLCGSASVSGSSACCRDTYRNRGRADSQWLACQTSTECVLLPGADVSAAFSHADTASSSPVAESTAAFQVVTAWLPGRCFPRTWPAKCSRPRRHACSGAAAQRSKAQVHTR